MIIGDGIKISKNNRATIIYHIFYLKSFQLTNLYSKDNKKLHY